MANKKHKKIPVLPLNRTRKSQSVTLLGGGFIFRRELLVILLKK
jgi:hypothetical protein